MRAVFVTPNLEVGGLERQWSILVPALRERGVDAEVVTLDGRGAFFDELEARDVPTKYLELHGRSLRGAQRAGRTIAELEPDLILSAGVSAHVVGQLASRRARAKHVAAIHAVPEHPDTFTFRRRQIVRLVAPRVSASTAVTSAQLPFLRSLGFDPATTRVIPNGVAACESRRSRNQIRDELGIDDAMFVVLFVAALRPEKRVDRFVRAVTAAHRTNASIRGLVVGGGAELERARALCAETGLVVEALGQRSDTPELMHAADVVCLTSDAEALPLVVVEAMACGRPVIATDVGGLRDAVVDGETGYLVAPADDDGLAARLTELAGNRSLLEQMGAAGRERHASRFTLERMVHSHHALFEELTSSSAALVAAPAVGAR